MQKNLKLRNKIDFTKTTLALAVMLSINQVYAQQQVYDNTSPTSVLEAADATDIDLSKSPLSGLSNTDMGLIYRTGTAITTTGANLLIDFTNPTHIPSFVIGGYSKDGTLAELNTVTVNSGTIQGSVYGAISHDTVVMTPIYQTLTADNTSGIGSAEPGDAALIPSAKANQNTVNINGSASIVNGSVFGGASSLYGQAADITVPTPANSTSTEAKASAEAVAVVSDRTIEANANNTSVTSGAQVNNTVYGGVASVQAFSANTIANSATSTGANARANATSYAQAENNILSANNNIVTLNQANLNGTTSNVYGGFTGIFVKSADATSAQATGLTHADANANVNARASGNSFTNTYNVITAEQSNINGTVYGGHASISVESGNALSNTAISTDPSQGQIGVDNVADANAISNAEAFGNNFTISNNKLYITQSTTVASSLYGGYATISAIAGSAKAGNAQSLTTYNAFAVANAVVRDNTIDVSANEVNVDKSSTINGSIYGGYAAVTAKAGYAEKGIAMSSITSEEANVDATNVKLYANNNIINFDGTLNGGSNIIGGYAAFDLTAGSTGTSGPGWVNTTGTEVQATHNIVTLGENTTISNPSTSIYGGWLDITGHAFAPDSVDLFTGNTLNFYAKPLTVQNVGNFEYYNFNIPTGVSSGDTLLTANTVDLKGSTVTLTGIAPGVVMPKNGEIVLIDATNLQTDAGTTYTNNVPVYQGISLIYDTTVEQADANRVVARFSGRDPIVNTPNTKPVLEGKLAGQAFLNQGIDLSVEQGIQSAMATTTENEGRLTPFGKFWGSSLRYKTGSHIDVNGFSGMMGTAFRVNNATVAGFVEGGRANYSSHNSFNNNIHIRGDGNAYYYGIGFLGRLMLENNNYIDASLRLGRVKTSFGSNDILSTNGEFAHYDSTSTYYGASIGVGHQWIYNEQTYFDASAKYLWAHQTSDSLIVGGDPFQFKSINSHRIRLMGKVYHQDNEDLQFVAGAGYEYEFGGKIKGSVYDAYNISAPTLKGGTGIAELGFIVTPTSDKRLTLDTRLNGYLGAREGVGASFELLYKF